MNSEISRLRSGYGGLAQELLEKVQASVGSTLTIKTSDGNETSGILIPRYEQGSRDYIVLKLKSGYNIGINANRIQSISLVQKEPAEKPSHEEDQTIQETSNSCKKSVLLLSTGGTIASKVDYRTGAVKPLVSAAELYNAMPELRKIANITPEIVFSELSENLGPKHWQILSEIVLSKAKEQKFDGMIIMVGTDTLGYISAALSFSLIGLRIPVVFVAAQRSSDRPSSDAALNIQAAIIFAANSGASGVFVAMHESENDEVIAIHHGSRVRKNHTSRRDAFQSIDIPLFARVRGSEILKDKIASNPKSDARDDQVSRKTKFSSSVALLKFYPGQPSSCLDYVPENEIEGLIMEGTGLGHVSSELVRKIASLIKSGVFVGMTSQCIWGHVDLNVYETGRDLLSAGVVPLSNMLAETAYSKLSWVLGNFDRKDTRALMLEPLAGEVTSRIILKN